MTGGGLRGCQRGRLSPSSLGHRGTDLARRWEEEEHSGQRLWGWKDRELPGTGQILTASGVCERGGGGMCKGGDICQEADILALRLCHFHIFILMLTPKLEEASQVAQW